MVLSANAWHRRARSKLIFVGPVGRQFLSAAEAETAASVLWFAAIQGIERNQDLANLAPQSCFVAAEAIECEVWQIGKTQKASRELRIRVNRRFKSIRN